MPGQGVTAKHLAVRFCSIGDGVGVGELEVALGWFYGPPFLGVFWYYLWPFCWLVGAVVAFV